MMEVVTAVVFEWRIVQVYGQVLIEITCEFRPGTYCTGDEFAVISQLRQQTSFAYNIYP